MMRILLAIGWVILFGGAFFVPQFIEPTGDGFVRGLNRLPYIGGVQCLALLSALGAAVLTFRAQAELGPWEKFVGYLPLGLHMLFILVIGIVLVFAIFGF